MSKELLLVGGGGHCHSCIDVIEQEARFTIAGVVEKPGEDLSGKIFDYPVLGTDDDLSVLRKDYSYALITIGQIKSAKLRMRLYEHLLELGFELPVIISPWSYVSPRAKIGQGTIVMHHALVNACVKVGANCIINSKSLVEHDTVIEDNCHIATGAVINGGSQVGKGSFVGSACNIKEGVTLDENCLLGMGTSLKKDIPKNTRINKSSNHEE